MVLMVSFNSQDLTVHPGTVIFLERSPLATAMVTLAMFRTCEVRFDAHRVHVVCEVLPGAGNTFDLGLTAELALGADFTSNTTHFRGETVELINHRVDRVLELRESHPSTSTVILRERSPRGDGGGDLGDVADLAGQVRRP